MALLVATLGAVDLVRRIDGFRGIGFAASSHAGIVRVEAVQSETGLVAGDRIVLVDGGNTPASAADLRTRLLAEPSSNLLVSRGGVAVAVSYLRPAPRVDYAYLALAAAGLLYLLIGVYTLLHARRAPAGLFFLWAMASAAVYLCTRTPGTPLDALVKASSGLEELARLLLPPLTLHLFSVFPVPVLGPALRRRLIPFLYLPAAVLITLQADLMLNDGHWFFGRVDAASLTAFDRLEIALIVVYSLVALLALGAQLFRRKEWEQRRQLQWIVLGLGAGYLPFVALYGIPWLLHVQLASWVTVAATAPLALVPLTFTWALLRFRLWNLEVILRSAASYGATLMLGVVSFSILQLAISHGLPSDRTLARSALSFLSGLAIAAVLVPAERRVRTGIERLQYGGGVFKRRALRELGRELLEERDLPRLCNHLQERLGEGLGLSAVALYLVEGEDLALASDSAAAAAAQLRLAELGPELWRERLLRLMPPGLPGIPATGAERLYLDGFRYAFPLSIRRRPVALLLTGERNDGQPLNSEELDLLRSVLDQTALALENARLVEELRDQLEEVTRLKQHSEQILDSSPAGIVVLDGEERVVSANLAFAALAGSERSRLLGRRLSDLLPVRPLPRTEEGLREVSYCDADGTERHLQLSVAACGRSEDDLRVLVVHDVSERVAMENTLKEKERLAALGMLAAGVAHEVNTPITGISSYAQMLLAETAGDDPRYELLKKVEKQTFRAASIVNNLLEFARDRRQEHRALPLARVMSEALDSLDDRVRRGSVEVCWQPPQGEHEKDALVLGGENELHQVFVNLIGNALDAMGPAGGRLELSLTRQGNRLAAVVGDSGPGISAAEQERIFRPFYSTKLNKGGTGLGLSISYQIVRRHGGDLRVESAPGTGSRFIVELPQAPARRPGDEPAVVVEVTP